VLKPRAIEHYDKNAYNSVVSVEREHRGLIFRLRPGRQHKSKLGLHRVSPYTNTVTLHFRIRYAELSNQALGQW